MIQREYECKACGAEWATHLPVSSCPNCWSVDFEAKGLVYAHEEDDDQ